MNFQKPRHPASDQRKGAPGTQKQLISCLAKLSILLHSLLLCISHAVMPKRRSSCIDDERGGREDFLGDAKPPLPTKLIRGWPNRHPFSVLEDKGQGKTQEEKTYWSDLTTRESSPSGRTF